MTRYFEIYVSGKNGFSTFVKTDKPLGQTPHVILEDEVLNLAIDAKVMEGGDASDVSHGGGYVEEMTQNAVNSEVNQHIRWNEI